MQNLSRACQCGQTSSTRSTRNTVPTSLTTSPQLPWPTDHWEPMRLWGWIQTRITYTPRSTASQSGEWKVSFLRQLSFLSFSLQRLRPPPVREPQLSSTRRRLASVETCSGPIYFQKKKNNTIVTISSVSFTIDNTRASRAESRVPKHWLDLDQNTQIFSTSPGRYQNAKDKEHKLPDV